MKKLFIIVLLVVFCGCATIYTRTHYKVGDTVSYYYSANQSMIYTGKITKIEKGYVQIQGTWGVTWIGPLNNGEKVIIRSKP